MAQTILITGASSGIGRATADLFAERGWNVIATMRNPDAETALTQRDTVFVTRLDVTDPASIDAAVAAGIDQFASIDALVNNAGYGAYGPLEATPRKKIVRQFDTNVIGLLDTTKAVVPHMRRQGHGVIVNVSSVGGKITLPLGTLYHGSKFAVEGLSEALSYEMESIGVRVKIVEPGIIDTDFSGRSLDISNDETLGAYQPLVAALQASQAAPDRHTSPPSLVAEVIHEAVTDRSTQLRYTAGDDAAALIAHRTALDDDTFINGIKTRFGLVTT
jgi:NAD(P)-dependent dehydrogenase (short-subunit alcohol dehydrogenase family)